MATSIPDARLRTFLTCIGADSRSKRSYRLQSRPCLYCPYVKAIRERIVRDCKELAAHGIGSIAIMANDPVDYPEDSFANMQQVAREFGFPLPYVLDESQAVASVDTSKAFGCPPRVARAYDAVCTPEFFGYNAALELQYHGRLDASKSAPVAGARRELFEAMVSVAQTGRGPVEQTTPIGCSIKWKR